MTNLGFTIMTMVIGLLVAFSFFIICCTFIRLVNLQGEVNELKLNSNLNKNVSTESSSLTTYIIRTNNSGIKYFYENVSSVTVSNFSYILMENKMSNCYDNCLCTSNKDVAQDVYDRLHSSGFTTDIYEGVPNFYV